MTRPCETPGCPHRARPRRGNAGRHPRWCADCTRARRATSNATYYANHRAACLARHASHYALHAERKKAARRQRYLESKRAALRAILNPEPLPHPALDATSGVGAVEDAAHHRGAP